MNFRHCCILMLSFLCLSVSSASGQDRKTRFTFGAEWMYSSNFFNAHQFNYTAGEEGYRVNDEAGTFEYTANGGVLGHVGVDFLGSFNASVYAGYLGVYRRRNVVPVLAGVSWFPKGTENDGFLVNLRGGIAFQEYIPVMKLAFLSSVGCGYRLSLAKWVDLDFLAGIQATFDNPPIPNPDGRGYVSPENIRKDDAQYIAVNLGIALTF